MPTPVGFDPSSYNSATSGGFNPGSIYEYNGSLYKFIKTVDAVNVTNGMVLELASTSGTQYGTVDRSGGSSVGRIPIGVAVGSITAGNYGFILIKGVHTAIKDALNTMTAVGDKATTHGSTDGDAAKASAYTNNIFAVGLTIGASGTFQGLVNI